MAKPEETDGGDDARLFEVVLAEAVQRDLAPAMAARLSAASAAERELAWRRAEAAEPGAMAMAAGSRPSRAWIAAALLLGCAVVALTMVWRPAPAAVVLRRPQEPAAANETKARDLAHFLALVRTAKGLRIGASETVGATLQVDATGAVDRLDVVPWPEVVRVDGEALGAWCTAIANSAGQVENATRFGALLCARFELPDGSELVAGLSSGDEVHLDPSLGGGVVRPNAELRALILAAQAEVERLHRRACGIARDALELDALPAAALHVECTWAVRGSLVGQLRRFGKLQSLVLRAEGADAAPGAAVLQALGELRTLQALDVAAELLGDEDCGLLLAPPSLQRLRLRGGNRITGAGFAKAGPGLRELTLERCQGLTPAGMQALGRGAPMLQTLRLLGCGLGDDSALLAGLPGFPSLQNLTLRGQEILGAHLAPLLRTKLRSLRLIDVPLTGRDLAAFAGLPSLREFAMLSPKLDDGVVADLAAMRQLERLSLMNARITPDGLQQLKRALPACAVDCVPGRRRFDSGTWILP